MSTAQPTDSVTVEVPIEECLNGKTRAESDLDEDAIEDFVEWTKDIERSSKLREIARERVDDDTLPEAETLLWIDQAEVYALCRACYRENSDGAWTGTTSNPNYDELKQKMNQRLSDGCACAFCKSDRIDEKKEQIKDEIDVDVVIIE
jgi:hypothetical protein